MAYFTPYIDTSGLHIPAYTEIRDSLVEDAKTIFGQDIYLEPDSQDYQYISAVALKINDAFLAAQMVYNSRSPSGSIGTTLDSIVKLNGIKRKSATYSTASVTLTGTAGTVITNGIVGDVSGNNWSLPVTVTIGAGGTVQTTATCQIAGAILASAGDINKIVTPTAGWTGVTNTIATVGAPVESDGQLRSRQAISTARPSRTMLEGTTGGIAEVPGVTRYRLYENDTNVTDSHGLPAHSITAVVEGGANLDIATAIYQRKGIGCYTNGDISVGIVDSSGRTTNIRFYRPAYVDIKVTVSVKALAGYTTQTTADIKENVMDYLNSLDIGESLTLSALWGAALSAMPNLRAPAFSITSLTAGKGAGPQGTTDIPIGFNEVTRGSLANITVNVS